MLRFAMGLVLAAATSQPQPALVEAGGIRFDEMPVSCKFHGRSSSGAEVIDVYVGKSGRQHVMKSDEDRKVAA